MGGGGSGITWLEAKDWIGRRITFDGEHWELTQKISEREFILEDYKNPGEYREADSHGVFICRELQVSNPKEVIVKIYLQIPAFHHADPASVRARRAKRTVTSSYATWETKILAGLTAADCSSAPKLLGTKTESQDWKRAWVPGGWVYYIFMEKVPGITPRDFFDDFDIQERESIRRAFKEAWLDCARCGYVNDDEAIRNVIWDKRQSKCYIIDWEQGSPIEKGLVWRNYLWSAWGMARRDGGDLDDMTGWTLYDCGWLKTIVDGLIDQ